MVRICASGYGLVGGRITDPFSLPDGTPVTKVGLDRESVRAKRLGQCDIAKRT